MQARRSFRHLSIALLCSGLLNGNWEIDLPILTARASLSRWSWLGLLSDTVFQGSLLIDENALLGKYPQHEGYQLFLIDD